MQKKKFVDENLQVIYSSKRLDFSAQKKATKEICANDLKKENEKTIVYKMNRDVKKRVAAGY